MIKNITYSGYFHFYFFYHNNRTQLCIKIVILYVELIN